MFKKAMIASAVLAAAFGAQAQTSAGWQVSGTVTPGACVVALTGNGMADFGAVSATTVKTYAVLTGTNYTSYNYPTTKTMGLSVVCPAAIKQALSVTDGKANTAIDHPTSGFDPYMFGLGLDANNARIGGYLVTLSGYSYKVQPSDTAVSPTSVLVTAGKATSSSAFTLATSTARSTLRPGYSIAYQSSASSVVPEAFSEIGVTLTFSPKLNKAVVDAATGLITLAGSGTIELVTL